MGEKMKKQSIITIAIVLTLVISSIPFLADSNAEAQVTPAASSYDYSNYTKADLLKFEWTQDRNGPALPGFVDGPGPSSVDVLWKKTGLTFTGGFNGMVFASGGGKTYGLDPWTGAELWQTNRTGSLIKLNNQYMIMGSTCLETATGKVMWTAPFSAGTNTLYIQELGQFFTAGGAMYKLTAGDMTKAPTLAWNRSDLWDGWTSYGWNTYGDGRLFIRQPGLRLQALNATTGSVLWAVPTKGRLVFGGVYHEGVFLSGSLDGGESGWDGATGKLLWTFNPGTYWDIWANRPGAAAHGLYYGINQDNHIYANDVHTGKLVWSYEGPGNYYNGDPLVIGDKVYAQMGNAHYRNPDTGKFGSAETVCLDALTGRVIFKEAMQMGGQQFTDVYGAFGNLYGRPQWTFPYYGNIPGAGGGSLDELWCVGPPKDWSMFGGDAAHSNSGAGPQILSLKWKFETGAAVTGSATIVDGIAYVGSYDANIYAINAETGAKIWSFKTGYNVMSSQAVVGGKLYTGADDGNIYCLDARTGTQIWKLPVGGPTIRYLQNVGPTIRSSPAVVGGKEYVGHLNGNLYCIDTNTGTPSWVFPTGGQVLGSPAVVDGAVYINSNTQGRNGTLYKLNANTGDVIWKLGVPYGRPSAISSNGSPTSTHWFASPNVQGGLIFIPADGVNQYCINATTGAIIWSAAFSGDEESLVVNMASIVYDPPHPSWERAGSIVMFNETWPKYVLGQSSGRVFTMDSYFSVVCLNATNGQTLWTKWMGREIYGLAYANNKVYVSWEQKAVFVLDANTGEKVSYWEIPSMIWSNPTLYKNRMYVGCQDWNLYCFEEKQTGTKYYGAQAAYASVGVSPSPSAIAPAGLQGEPVQSPVAEPIQTQPSTSALLTEVLIAVAAVVVITQAVIVAVVLKKRR